MIIRDVCITMLKEIQEKNSFTNTKMAALLGISTYQYTRWIRGTSFTKSANTLNQIEKVVKEYHKAG